NSEAHRISGHLSGCSSCRSVYDELRRVCSSLRTHASVIVVLVPLSGLALTASSAGLGAAVAASAGGGAGAVGAVALGGGGKVGLSFVSAAAVAGLVGTPVLDAVESGRVEPPLDVDTFVESSSGTDNDDGPSSGTGSDVVRTWELRRSAAVEELAVSESDPLESTSVPLEVAEYTLPAESVGVESPVVAIPPSSVVADTGRSEPSDPVPPESPRS